jgi:pyruvate dehydrogenase E2 component (dihydrolipoamide acetyltransferase)
MAKAVIMPKQGLLMTEGTIIEWLKKEGQKVEVGEPLFEMETDKLTITIEAQEAGTLLKIVRGEGETVPITEIIAIIGEPGEDISDLLGSGTKVNCREPQNASAGLQETADANSANESGQRIFITPRAKMIASEKGVDYNNIHGSGPDGLITEKDILQYLEKTPEQPKATPLAAKIAAINDISLTAVKGSGERGKITKADVEVVIEAGKTAAETAGKAKTAARGERLVPFTAVRKIIADKMTKSLREMAQANHRMKVDVSEIIRLRDNLKAADVKITLTDIFVRVIAKALTEFPEINSSYTSEGILFKEYINIGIAVASPNGLIVPVVKDADLMSLKDIAAVSSELIDKARNGKLQPDDYTGGTFTITNLGMFDIDEFTAIVNPPESAILALGKINREPVVEGDSIVIRPIMVLSLTYDHRVIDGAPAAMFLQKVKKIMLNPYLLI